MKKRESGCIFVFVLLFFFIFLLTLSEVSAACFITQESRRGRQTGTHDEEDTFCGDLDREERRCRAQGGRFDDDWGGCNSCYDIPTYETISVDVCYTATEPTEQGDQRRDGICRITAANQDGSCVAEPVQGYCCALRERSVAITKEEFDRLPL